MDQEKMGVLGEVVYFPVIADRGTHVRTLRSPSRLDSVTIAASSAIAARLSRKCAARTFRYLTIDEASAHRSLRM